MTIAIFIALTETNDIFSTVANDSLLVCNGEHGHFECHLMNSRRKNMCATEKKVAEKFALALTIPRVLATLFRCTIQCAVRLCWAIECVFSFLLTASKVHSMCTLFEIRERINNRHEYEFQFRFEHIQFDGIKYLLGFRNWTAAETVSESENPFTVNWNVQPVRT